MKKTLLLAALLATPILNAVAVESGPSSYLPSTYVAPDGTEYMDGYQPPGSVLKTNPSTTASSRASQQPIPFRVSGPDVRPGYATGWEIGAMGGVDALQSGSFHDTFTDSHFSGPYGNSLQSGSLNMHQNSGAGSFVGVSVGYTWAGFHNDANTDGSQFVLLPALQLDAFYINRTSKADGSEPDSGPPPAYINSTLNANQNVNLSIYAMTADYILRAQAGIFRPYIGLGGGAAIVDGTNLNISINSNTAYGSDYGTQAHVSSSVAPVLQALAGTDIFLTRNLSLFGEYRYIGLGGVEFNVNSGGGTSASSKGNWLSDNVFDAGLRWHF